MGWRSAWRCGMGTSGVWKDGGESNRGAQATGSSVRTITAPHVHVIQTRSPATPPSRSPRPLTSERERLLELGLHLRPRLRTPARCSITRRTRFMRSQGCERRALVTGSSLGGQRTYAVSATPMRKTSHATNQDERHPGLRKLIPPPETVVLPIIGRTPTPIVPRTMSARAIFVQVVIVITLPSLRDREALIPAS
jgi:hypothetical protein